MVSDTFANGQKSKLIVMPLTNRSAVDFVELVNKQELIDIYQRIHTAILMDHTAPIHRSEIAKNMAYGPQYQKARMASKLIRL